MSVSDGQPANQDTFNNAFASKTDDNTMTGVQDLNNSGTASGVQVTNLQREHNSVASYTGKAINALKDVLPTWVSTAVGLSTDNLTERAEALTAFAGTKGQADGIAPLDSSSQVPLANLPDSVTGSRQYLGNWAASTNTPTLDNATDAGVVQAGSEYNVSDDGTVDFGAGNITFTNGDTVIFNGTIWSKIDGSIVRDLNDIRDVIETSTSAREQLVNDGTDWRNFDPNQIGNDAATGANQTLTAPGDLAVVRLTDGGLTSVDGVPDPGYAQRFILVNTTGGLVTINNETGATAENRILTGSGTNLLLADDGVLVMVYDSTDSRWRITGGSGGGGANDTLSNLASPTAVNQDLLMDGTSPALQTPDVAGATTKTLDVKSGNVTGAGAANSGNLNISSGTANGASQFSGNVQISSGTGGSFGSGGVTVSTGSSSGGSGGGVSVNTGNNSGGTSGNIAFNIGTASSSQGDFKFLKSGQAPNIGDVFTATGTDGSGYWSTPSDSSGVSVISGADSTFEVDDISWDAYADAADSIPVDGDGGSPNVAVTRTVNPAEVVRGTASLKISKDAANRQGEGAVVNKSVDVAFRGKSNRVSFNYFASANFDFGTVSTDSDATVWAYDVTNSKLLGLNNNRLSGEGRFESDIFIPSSCENIRYIIHVATTNASAWDLFADDFLCELVPFTSFNNMSDWVDGGALQIGATTSAPTKGTTAIDQIRYKTNGQNVDFEITYRQTAAGTAGSGTYIYTLPNSYQWGEGVQTSTTDLDDEPVQYFGPIQIANGQGNVTSTAWIKPYDATRFSIIIGPAVTDAGSGSTSTQNQQGSAILQFSQTELNIRGTFSAPILGRTSGAKHPAAIGLNAKGVMRAFRNGGGMTANTPIITWTVEEDSLGSFDQGTGVYTVKSPGDYYVVGNLALNAVSGAFLKVYKNGVSYQVGSNDQSNSLDMVATLIPGLSYGDTIDLRCSASVTSATQNDGTSLSIFKLGSESQPYAPRVAFLKDTKTSGTDGGGSTATTYIKRDISDVSGDFYSTSSGVLTLEPGTYHIEGSFPAYSVGSHKVKLRNTTDSTDDIVGKSSFTDMVGGDDVQNNALISGEITIGSVKNFEFQHWTETAQATDGFGVATSDGAVEIYGEVKITKIL